MLIFNNTWNTDIKLMFFFFQIMFLNFKYNDFILFQCSNPTVDRLLIYVKLKKNSKWQLLYQWSNKTKHKHSTHSTLLFFDWARVFCCCCYFNRQFVNTYFFTYPNFMLHFSKLKEYHVYHDDREWKQKLILKSEFFSFVHLLYTHIWTTSRCDYNRHMFSICCTVFVCMFISKGSMGFKKKKNNKNNTQLPPHSDKIYTNEKESYSCLYDKNILYC